MNELNIRPIVTQGTIMICGRASLDVENLLAASLMCLREVSGQIIAQARNYVPEQLRKSKSTISPMARNRTTPVQMLVHCSDH